MNSSKSTLKFLPIVGALALSFAASAEDWTQYRGPSFDGKSSEKLPSTSFPGGGPRVAWKVPSPNGFSSFTVADGMAFTLETANVGGAQREALVARNATNGKVGWSLPLGAADYGHNGGDAGTRDNKGGDGARSTPAFKDGKVYVMTADLGLLCADAKTGKRIWAVDLGAKHAGVNIKWKNAASPIIDGDLVFVAGGGSGQALIAFNKDSGKVAWKTQDDLMTHATPTVTDLHSVRQVIFFTQKGLVSLKTDTGSVLWRYDFPFQVSTASSPVVAGDIVYCSAGYGVGAGAVKVEKTGAKFTASEIYRVRGNKDLANHWSSPIHHEGYLYGMFQFKEYGEGPVKCVDVKTGKIMWEKEGFGPGNVTYADGHFIALTDAGVLVIFKADPTKYVEVARAKVLDGKCWTTPTLANGKVYIRSTKEAACVDLAGGRVASR